MWAFFLVVELHHYLLHRRVRPSKAAVASRGKASSLMRQSTPWPMRGRSYRKLLWVCRTLTMRMERWMWVFSKFQRVLLISWVHSSRLHNCVLPLSIVSIFLNYSDWRANREHVQLQEEGEGSVCRRGSSRCCRCSFFHSSCLSRRSARPWAHICWKHPETGDGQETSAQDQRSEKPGSWGSGKIYQPEILVKF